MSVLDKAMELFQDEIEPLMIAINYDSVAKTGLVLEEDQVFRLAVTLQLYALSKGKSIRVDPETKMVIME